MNIPMLIAYYTNLLIIQYNNKPKARATVGAIAEQALAGGVYTDVRDAFDIETAVGKQLDVIGKYVGVDRTYQGQEWNGGFFSLGEYTEPPVDELKIGFSDYSDFDTKEGAFLDYSDIVSGDNFLNDADYRNLIRLKIFLNNSNFSHKEIDDFLANNFGGSIIADSSGDMRMLFFVPTTQVTFTQVVISKGLLPVPMAVGVHSLISRDSPMFGLMTYGDDSAPYGIMGFATYDEDVAGEFLTYNKMIEV